ncbi:MAG: carboxypeptidase regulatory-like domain-containing protein [Chromatiales bacterium]|nr:carboxypeptidase regulatory-like domain-containing protein [Chromatiales bacterium]
MLVGLGWLLLAALASEAVRAQASYRFERMWPSLAQPWYFNASGLAVDSDGFVYVADNTRHRIVKLSPDGRLVTEWGGFGNGDGEFRQPLGVAVGLDGLVHVVDLEDRVQVFTADGAFVRTFGAPGSGPGRIGLAFGIAVDGVGNVYVADRGNARITKFAADGRLVVAWGSAGSGSGQFIDLSGVAVDAEGFVYAVDEGNPRVQKFTGDGVFVGSWGSAGVGPGEFSVPAKVAVDAAGFVYVTEGSTNPGVSHRVQKFTADGSFVAEWGGFGAGPGQFDYPREVAVGPDGRVHVSDTGRVQTFTADGAVLAAWGSGGAGPGRFGNPEGIAIDDEGAIHVADTRNNRVQVFDATGAFVREWPTCAGPKGVALDAGGDFFVACTFVNAVVRYDASGQQVASWGGTGSGNGQFRGPERIAVGADHVFVTDNANHRVQAFTRSGGFVRAWGGLGSGPGQFSLPRAVAVGPDGRVYVADQGNDRVQIFTDEGVYLSEIAGGALDAPSGLAFDAVGNLFVSLPFAPGFLVYDAAGTQIASYLGDNGIGPGDLQRPTNLAVAGDGRVVMLDTLNNRVQILRPVQGAESATKAIVVAGGGPFAGNALWDATQAQASFAYRTLTFQGLPKSRIHYLSSDTDLDLDGNGLADDVDTDATRAALETAIVDWASDADEVIVYLTDHGGEGAFRLSATEIVTAAELDGWLDILQQRITGEVVVIYDACAAGSFVPALRPPPGRQRVVIASSSASEVAHFTGHGLLSFSSFFWTQVFNGRSVGEGFDRASAAMGFAPSTQTPLVDADGDGVANEAADTARIADRFVGAGTVVASDAPVIGAVSAPQTITGASEATLTAFGVADDDGIARVWAVLRPPDYQPGSTDNAVTEMPELELLETAPGSGEYRGVHAGFTTPGTYQIAVYALDTLGNTSLPKLTTVSVGNPTTRRAVIVAGGDAGDPAWPAIERAATAAYRALRFQGFGDAQIAFASATTVNGIESLNLRSNVAFALAPAQHADSQDVLLHLVGPADAEGFALADGDRLSAQTLDAWLDALQDVIPGRLTVVMDGDAAGEYVGALDAPAGRARDRVRIASTTSAGGAGLPSAGAASFSQYFFQQVANGARLRDAFVHARDGMRVASAGTQAAHLDADGDGDSDKFDLALVSGHSLGAGILLAGDAPLIGAVSPPAVVSDPGAVVTVWVEGVTSTGTVARVFASVSAPDAGAQVEPVVVDLDDQGSGRWEAELAVFGSTAGEYRISVLAVDGDGVVSAPAETLVTQLAGADVFEDDDVPARAAVLSIDDGDASLRTIHDPGDSDWLVFYAVAGEPYTIQASAVGAELDLALELYPSSAVSGEGCDADRDGNRDPSAPCLALADDAFEGGAETLVWVAPGDGFYHLRARAFAASQHGVGTDYRLSATRSTAPFVGALRGRVRDARSHRALALAWLTTDGNASALSKADGSFNLVDGAGSYLLRVSAPGYLGATRDVDLSEGGTTQLTVELVPADVDHDGLGDGFELYYFGHLGATPGADSDADGLDNAAEELAGTDPLTADSDADGLPDGYEVAHGLNPNDAGDAALDPDGDGWSTRAEHRAGSDPNDRRSTPAGGLIPLLMPLLVDE